MSLCRMPLEGKWEKEGEEWKNVCGTEVETGTISLLNREKIEELCRKKVYRVAIPKVSHTHIQN